MCLDVLPFDFFILTFCLFLRLQSSLYLSESILSFDLSAVRSEEVAQLNQKLKLSMRNQAPLFCISLMRSDYPIYLPRLSGALFETPMTLSYFSLRSLTRTHTHTHTSFVHIHSRTPAHMHLHTRTQKTPQQLYSCVSVVRKGLPPSLLLSGGLFLTSLQSSVISCERKGCAGVFGGDILSLPLQCKSPAFLYNIYYCMYLIN